jgi:ubiquinone/menaquinone biosynthesis C-methylase UbiE
VTLEDERAAWDSVADAWQRWWPHFEAGAQPLNNALVALAAVPPGGAVLDLASGIGEPALTAARCVGPTGRVLAVDLAPRMLAIARERAAAAGVRLETLESAAEDLDLPPATFDAATCRWGLMLAADPVAAAERVHEALRPGGRFAVAVWAEPKRAPFLSLPRTVLQRELGLPAPDADAPGPFRLAAPGALRRVLDSAAFRTGDEIEHVVTMTFDRPADYARFVYEVSSSARHAIDEQPPAVRTRVRAAIEAAAATHARADGKVAFANVVRVVVGVRP